MASGSEDKTTATKRQRLTTTTNGTLPTLPFDLNAEILCRLSVKLLLQLRCLCNFFNSLISDPKFTKKHLRLSPTRHRLIESSRNYYFHELILYDSAIPSVFSTSSVKHTQLSYPTCLKTGYGIPMNMCSCDGILCFTMDQGCVILWNPSIGRFKILPTMEITQKGDSSPLYSFGYDHFIHNYKIVAISFLKDKKEVNVHVLGTESWRRIQDFPYSCSRHISGVFVSGTVHWLAYDGALTIIVSLDLEKEAYQKLSQPPGFEMSFQTLWVLKNCLISCASSSGMILDVWVTKEYGNKDSWTKLYNIITFMGNLELHMKTLYISEDDQMLMDFYEEGNPKSKLVLYDSKNHILNIPENQNTPRWIDPEVYVESLISPCS